MKTAQKKKILITGVSGLLGSNLAYAWQGRFELCGVYHQHRVALKNCKTIKADILDLKALKNIIADFKPDAIVHCAALADVDFCEKNPELARQINVGGTANIVEAMPPGSMKLVYISSDAVYDGTKEAYSESDPVNPLSYYAQSKYDGELEAAKRKGALIARTSIFGWNVQDKNGLAEWMVEELSHRRKINGFTDVLTSMIYTIDLAGLLGLAIEKNISGVYHFASRTAISKCEFAVKLADLFGFDKSLIAPVSVKQSNLKAKRSKNLLLKTDKLAKALGCLIPTITESLSHFYNDFKSGLPSQLGVKALVD